MFGSSKQQAAHLCLTLTLTTIISVCGGSNTTPNGCGYTGEIYSPPLGTPQAPTNVNYNNGSVMLNTTNHLIFWMPSTGTSTCFNDYVNTINQFFVDEAASPQSADFYNVYSQYYEELQGSRLYPAGPPIYGGSFRSTTDNYTEGCTAHDAFTNCVPADKMVSFIEDTVIRQHPSLGWRVGPEQAFFVFLGPGEWTCTPDEKICVGPTGHCTAAHFYDAPTQLIYAVIPYPNRSCPPLNGPHDQNDPAIDIAISLASHEQAEMITDPTGGGGWYNAAGEIGDLCEVARVPPALHIWNGNQYLIQTEWSDLDTACVAGRPMGLQVPSQLPSNYFGVWTGKFDQLYPAALATSYPMTVTLQSGALHAKVGMVLYPDTPERGECRTELFLESVNNNDAVTVLERVTAAPTSGLSCLDGARYVLRIVGAALVLEWTDPTGTLGGKAELAKVG